MESQRGRNLGFGLIELMVALVAGLIVSYAVVAFTMSSMKSNAEYVQSTKLTQGLRSSLDLVTRDMRRAGYDDNALARLAGGAGSVAPGAGASPFAKVSINNANPSPTNGACVIYAYDRPGGTAGALDGGEVRAMRRVVVTPSGASAPVGVIEYAVSSGIKPACDGATAVYTSYPPTCNGTSLWCPLTDSSTINISGFTITEKPGTSADPIGADPTAVRVRNLIVGIEARLVGDDGTSYLNGVSSSFTRRVEAAVKIRTDCVLSAISNCNDPP